VTIKLKQSSNIEHRRYANKIADKMEAAGEIKRLHRDFKSEINTAQYSNVSGAMF